VLLWMGVRVELMVIAVPAIDPKRDYSLSRTQQSADWDEAPQYRNTRAALQDEVI